MPPTHTVENHASVLLALPWEHASKPNQFVPFDVPPTSVLEHPLEQPSPPIARLPMELLSTIFTLLATSDDKPHPKYPDGAVPSTAWIVVMRVCKYWRGVALNTVGLWQRITVGGCVEWLGLALARSMNVPVDVSLLRADKTLYKAVSLLTEVAPRLRLLHVYEATANSLPVLHDTLFAHGRLPLLQELVVDCEEGRVHDNANMFGEFGDERQLPSLRVLGCMSVWVPWESPVFRNLRVLKMSHTFPQEPTPLANFVAMLQGCHSLEELHLHHVPSILFPQEVDEENARVVQPSCIASLPRLRVFTLWHNQTWYDVFPSKPFQLLEHLRLPETASVIITLEACVADYTPFSYLDAIPRDTDSLPILRSALSARLKSDPKARWISIEASRGPLREGVLHLDFDEYVNDPSEAELSWPYQKSAQIRDFCTLFSQSPLESLTLESLDLRDWPLADVFRAFPSLRTLEVFFNDKHVRHDLAELVPLLVSGPRADPGSPTTIVLPSLRALRLKDIALSVYVPYVLLAALILRARRGTRWPELWVEWSSRRGDEADLPVVQDALLVVLETALTRRDNRVYINTAPPRKRLRAP
ncbi:hypothetical protein BD413DRAFT_225465 [Trametes elegans]|nr:hypothetical protein BD413DRAFT_225465 [Trametes elegans]